MHDNNIVWAAGQREQAVANLRRELADVQTIIDRLIVARATQAWNAADIARRLRLALAKEARLIDKLKGENHE